MRQVLYNTESTWSGGEIQTLTLSKALPYRLHTFEIIYERGVGDEQHRATLEEIEEDIEYIEFQIGGTPQRRIYPEKLFKLEAQRGFNFSDGRIPVRFSEPWRRSMFGEDRTALILNRLGAVTFKVQFNTQPAPPAPRLSHRLIVSELTREENEADNLQGPIVTTVEKYVEVSEQGKKVTSFTPTGGRAISQIHAFSVNITAVRVHIGNTLIWDFPDKHLLSDQLRDMGMTPDANIWSFGGEVMTRRITDTLALGRHPLLLEFQMKKAGHFVMEIEQLGAIKI